METPCWCSLEGHKYGGGKSIETCLWVFLLECEFIAWGTHKDESYIYFETRNVYIAKSEKNGNVFKPHKSAPGHELNAMSCRSLEVQASSIAKQRTPSNWRFVQMNMFSCCNTSWK